MFGGIGSLVVANAKSMGMVTSGFTIMDIAYGTQPLLHAVTSEVIPRRWRGWGQATNMISNSLGSTVGLIAGGALNRTNDPMSNGFRHFYYMVMGCFLLGAVICLFVYNPPKSERQALSTREKLSRLDWVGYFLLSSGLTLFCVALSLSQNPYTWADPCVSAPFAVGLGLLISLAVHEIIIKKDGMFHHDLFTFAGNHNFAICIICVIAEGAAFFAANSYFVFQISVLYEPDSLLAGLRYTIMFLVAGLGAAFAGYLCAHTRQTRWLTVSAFMLFIVFFVCMVLTDITTNRPVWGYPVIMGVALGITLTTLVTTAQISTPPRLIALASGLMLSSRAIDGAVGLACYHAIFVSDMNSLGHNVAQAVIPAGLDPQDVGQFVSALAAHNNDALHNVPGVTPLIIQRGVVALLDTYVLAFSHVWIAGCCFVALAGVFSFFIVDCKEEYNMHIDAPLETVQHLK